MDLFLKIGLLEAGPLGGAPKLDLFRKLGLPEGGPLGGAPKLGLNGLAHTHTHTVCVLTDIVIGPPAGLAKCA